MPKAYSPPPLHLTPQRSQPRPPLATAHPAVGLCPSLCLSSVNCPPRELNLHFTARPDCTSELPPVPGEPHFPGSSQLLHWMQFRSSLFVRILVRFGGRNGLLWPLEEGQQVRVFWWPESTSRCLDMSPVGVSRRYGVGSGVSTTAGSCPLGLGPTYVDGTHGPLHLGLQPSWSLKSFLPMQNHFCF